MKKLSAIIIAMALVLGMGQCKKQETPATPDNNDGMVYITVNVENGGRHHFEPSVGAYIFTNGDTLYVGNNGHFIGKLEYQDGAFSGGILSPSTNDYLHFYFFGGKTPATAPTMGETTDFTISIADQSGDLPILAYGRSAQKYSGPEGPYSTTLRNKCALVKFNVATLSVAPTCITGMKNEVTVSFAENTLTPSKEGDGIITLSEGSGEKWAILLPQEAMAAGVEGSAYSSNGTYTGTCEAVPAIAENGYLPAGIDVDVTTNVIPEHIYVDLGLPLGTLWATCNVGALAITPEAYGDYFAWGETEPKNVYDWTTYKYCEGTDNTLTKYCYNASYGYNGFTDRLRTLLPEDDAATANWGPDWRMPTKSEWNDLVLHTDMRWTTLNGVSGMLFTAKNGSGNSIFLPAAGEKGFEVPGADAQCFYWSNGLASTTPRFAVYATFYEGYEHVDNMQRFLGLSVRPVRSSGH